ncbi:hypothetical protein CKY12_23380 [Photorhabdus sp. S12-55]|uniref:Photorhabdus luminescens subsp. laumondii TTO1 complete genome segment 12/17 n=1 Tax=Photorhabdus laumondii subsp. laumondii (strain DSM 15139 / CIP 105565 / TT01) TaxID=243265 RepID=Q7N248_PHOLL|nr:hypothetical protein A4R40_16235 [Photorhabdus laumondii subsp. laumondii]RAW64190.1 hypothetical protein CKY15_23285 [Photorhabdus sp. S7-51]RAW65305.1 hypothetical protein CKY14_23500 [Photorhabdus sp. S14-60]RAW70455.1 hypothetical protein CKY06_23370 [Photorhabdus sp. S15-56]RAW78666.1 hypothetical protein CKY09_23145 [Photorhabdus sp. S5P8-50]RAW78690.1 hypothetical protein CKY12_23380 [Photorhabdus sp. S12-55]CAE15623.1 unnamed protein product [Photorhabdus laumondii subsp. laumondii
MGFDVISFGFWGLALYAYVFLLFYTWPIIVMLDVSAICRIKKCIKDKKYWRASFLIFAAVLMSGSLIFFMVWIGLYG